MDCMAERFVEHCYEDVKKRFTEISWAVCKVDDEMLLNLGSEEVADEFTYIYISEFNILKTSTRWHCYIRDAFQWWSFRYL